VDLLTSADLEFLAQADPGEAQISLFLPTHRFGGEIQADQLRWKNLVAGVESVLAERMRRPDVDDLLAPARALHEDAMAWQYMSDGLAMYLRPGWHRTFRVAARVPELATVGDRLVLGPLLRLLSGDEHFLLLALSQREIRLMGGSRNAVEEVHLADMPTSLRDVVEPQEPRSDTMARPASAASRGGPAIFYGHGAGDEDLKKDELARFLREVSTGLRDVLGADGSPMVLVGLEQLVAAYREVNSYGHVLDDAVLRSSDQLSADELHQLAWPVIEQRLRDERGQVIELFRELHGTGRVSSDPSTVLEAATHGRVETLFVQADPWCWERDAAGSPPIVQLGVDDRYDACVQVDAVAVATLSGGGHIYATSESVVQGAEVAAIFRY
jgi:hypothetical protein